MEETRKNGAAETKPLSYEELKGRFGELYAQYQKAMGHIRKLEEALSDSAFNRVSFLISMLFRVMEHLEQYRPEFVRWASQNIESALTEFADSMTEEAKRNVGEKDKEKAKDEA